MNSQNKESVKNEENEIISSHNSDDGHVHGPNCYHHHHHEVLKPIMRSTPKIGRNDPCPCGSQKKFKKCCGQ
jgi:uncharacterized protein YecA (UPF0149 family)